MSAPFLAIVAALEALGAGDAGYAVELLLGALEDGPADRPYRCPACGTGYEWPGLLDAHRLRCDGLERQAA